MGKLVVGSGSRRRSDAGGELDRVLASAAIEPVYQPIVKLEAQTVVAYEALARGPRGSLLEMPASLFGAAARHGRLQELDWSCRAAAISGAFGASYLPPAALFVNVEPVAAGQTVPRQYEALMHRAQSGLRVVFEFTERALTDHPSDVLWAVRALRRLGAMVALDDLGVDPRSLALLPFLEPEVVKLDMSLVHDPHSRTALETWGAVAAYVERTGALVVAEGIETPAHLQAARALGAAYGQGWLFGRPGPLPPPESWQPVELFEARPRPEIDAAQPPHAWLEGNAVPGGQVDEAGFAALWAHALEEAGTRGSAAVVLAAPGGLATGSAMDALRDLATSAAFVGLLMPGSSPGVPWLRTGTLDPGEPLAREACLCVIAPHDAMALSARPGPDGLITYRVSHDRHVAACAARRLMARIAPQR